MDAANTPRTTRDALILELLGDVGRLHDSVLELQRLLPEQTDESVRKLITVIRYIRDAGDDFQKQVIAYSSSELDRLKLEMAKQENESRRTILLDMSKKMEEMEQSYTKARGGLQAAANEKIQELVSATAKAVRNIVQQEITGASNESFVRIKRVAFVYAAIISLASGVLGASIAIIALTIFSR